MLSVSNLWSQSCRKYFGNSFCKIKANGPDSLLGYVSFQLVLTELLPMYKTGGRSNVMSFCAGPCAGSVLGPILFYIFINDWEMGVHSESPSLQMIPKTY